MLLPSPDRQKPTWEKLAVDRTNKIVRVNAPRTINECWFIHGSETDTAGYPVKILHRPYIMLPLRFLAIPSQY
ncbi:hypothetical protein VTN96DRAFT_3033 [Rasamsonia emersonii]